MTPDEARLALENIIQDALIQTEPTMMVARTIRIADALLAAGWTPPSQAQPEVTEAMVEAAAAAIWEHADDEVGWRVTLGLAAAGDTYLVGQVEWYREEARAALTAALSAQQGEVPAPPPALPQEPIR